MSPTFDNTGVYDFKCNCNIFFISKTNTKFNTK